MTATSQTTQTAIDEIADGIHRISTPVPPGAIPGGFTFNQFLITGEEPLLFHTGMRSLFPGVRQAMARVMDPARLRWVGFSHVEADECGAARAGAHPRDRVCAR
jgi:flavorubredoxin